MLSFLYYSNNTINNILSDKYPEVFLARSVNKQGKKRKKEKEKEEEKEEEKEPKFILFDNVDVAKILTNESIHSLQALENPE